MQDTPGVSLSTSQAYAELGRAGERAAVKLLRKWFRSVLVPGKDGGVDVTCSGWLVKRRQRECAFSVQVKSGTHYYRGVSVEPNTFNFWLRGIERQPVILFHYPDPRAGLTLPESAFPLHPWILENIAKVRARLRENRQIHIPIHAFRRVTSEEHVRDILVEEERRVTSKLRSALGTRTDAHFDEYEYFMEFPRVAHDWERFELGLGEEDVPLYNLFNVMDLHPLDRAPIERLEKAQVFLYASLQGDPNSGHWRLAPRFDAWTVAAARATAAKYEGFWRKAKAVLETWEKRPVTDVLVALQIMGVAGNMDQRIATQTATLLRRLAAGLPSRLNTLPQYRLAHHMMIAKCELFGEHRAGMNAVALAQKYPAFEIRHLRSYGWGFGPQVITYYDRAFRRNTVRSAHSRDYNAGMRDLLADLVGRSPQRMFV